MKNRILLVSLSTVLALSVSLVGCASQQVPEITGYTLTISGTEGGLVITPGEGTGSFSYDKGTIVSLMARPEEGYRLVSWTGTSDYEATPTTVTMDADRTVTAYLEAQSTPSSAPPNLVVLAPDISELSVSVNGVVSPGTSGTTVTRIHWDWGDGDSEDHWFPASHTYGEYGEYEINVTAHQSDGSHTTKTRRVSFYLSAPNLISPGNGASVQVPINLDWESVGSADTYVLQCATEPDFSGESLFLQVVIAESCYTIQEGVDGLGSIYWWRVKAVHDDRYQSFWSDVQWISLRSASSNRWLWFLILIPLVGLAVWLVTRKSAEGLKDRG